MTIRAKEQNWILSSRDIWRGSSCQHCTELAMAVATKDPLALSKADGHKPDLSGVLAIIQGNDYEDMLVAQLLKNIPAGQFVVLEAFSPVEKTKEVLASRPMAIAQAGLEKIYGQILLIGYADLLVRDDFEPGIAEDGTLTLLPSGRDFSGYTVWDIKHNSSAKDEHFFQVGGYIECLEAFGALSAHGKSGVITRSKEAVGRELAELIQGFKEASASLFEKLNNTSPSDFSHATDFVYECATVSVCKEVKCEYPSLCEQERYKRDDIGQLYGLHYTHRPKLEAAGFGTVASIATADPKDAAGVIAPEQFLKYQPWARAIHTNRTTGELTMATLVDPSEFRRLLPPKNEGDLFVDYEWYQPTGESTELIYMLSASDWDEEFYPFVAKSRDYELGAFQDFVSFLLERIEKFPEAHIYHFHNPETKKLEDLSARYGVLKDEVARVIEKMFDIKKHVVDGRMVNSLGKLGIKQLGKFYDSDHGANSWPDADDAVEDGLDSMKFFYDYLSARESGNEAKAEGIMKNILRYNKADCTATSRLYMWLYEGKFK
jgi:predicted RecB family nuclease